MTAREIEDDGNSVEMTMDPNPSYETVNIHNQTGAVDQPYEPVSVTYQVGGQQ